MTPDDRAMIDFVLRWSPSHDGDEYILPEFGLTPEVFYRRVLALSTVCSGEIDDTTSSLVRNICLAKLVDSPARRTIAKRPS